MIAGMKHIMMYLLVAFIALPFASCEHKDLCYHHPHTVRIIVNFDWQYAPDAYPEGMCLYFYPEEGGEARRFDLPKTGGEIDITVGKYNVVVYNNDTDSIKYSAGGFYEHKLYTRDGGIFEPIGKSVRAEDVPRPEGTSDERVVISPDMMWGCSALGVEIADAGSSYVHEVIDSSMKGPQLKIDSEEEVVFTFYPEVLVCTYTYVVKNLKNFKYVTEVSGLLTSMSGELYPATGELGKECVSIPFESGKDMLNSNIVGRFYTFGHHKDNEQKHYLELFMWYSDDYCYPFYWDVTDQVHNAPDPRNVYIELNATNVELPDPITNGSGFVPSVDEWITVPDDIEM